MPAPLRSLWMVGAVVTTLLCPAKATERLRFSATAVNAETGAAITEFRIVRGWVRDDLGDHAVMWEPHIKSDGLPDDPPVIDEEDLFGRKVRFVATAPGFQPEASPWYLGPGDREFQFRLRPGSDRFEGRVETPEGKPVPEATVAMRQYGDLLLIGGRLHGSGGDPKDGVGIRRTDSEGRFVVQRRAPDLRLAISHPEWGYAEWEASPSATNGVIRLRPWASIQGRLSAPPDPAQQLRVMVDLPIGENPRFLLIPINHEFEVPVDPEGRFVLSRVPPRAMELRLTQVDPQQPNRIISYTRVNLLPGQTAHPVVENRATYRPAASVPTAPP
ncbi:MAG: hypothetical protein JNK85_18315 [Verrucomicrobiales bacterium]|nr:hypothetical protein [Verrucomicrobiales bacterium]